MIVVMMMAMVMVVMMGMIMAMQIIHIMIMVVVLQDHIKITGTDTGRINIRYVNGISLQWKTVQSLDQFITICSQIQHGRHEHVAADATGTFQIQCFFHRFNPSFILPVRKPCRSIVT